MSYNLTFMDNSTSFLSTMSGVNTMSGDILGALILFVLGIMIFIALKNYDSKVSIPVTSFILSIAGLFLFTMEFIGIEIFIIPLVLLLISIFYVIASKG